MSAKLDEVANKEEPVIAFRAKSVKDSGTSSQESVNRFGEFLIIFVLQIYFIFCLLHYITLSYIIYMIAFEIILYIIYLYYWFYIIYYCFKLFGKLWNIISVVDLIRRMENSQPLSMESIFSIHEAELSFLMQPEHRTYVIMWMEHKWHLLVSNTIMHGILLVQTHNLNWKREILLTFTSVDFFTIHLITIILTLKAILFAK